VPGLHNEPSGLHNEPSGLHNEPAKTVTDFALNPISKELQRVYHLLHYGMITPVREQSAQDMRRS
jgi:hypothetical protein